jgi:hypothetical protein
MRLISFRQKRRAMGGRSGHALELSAAASSSSTLLYRVFYQASARWHTDAPKWSD